MAGAAMKMTSIFCLMMIFNGGFANPLPDPTIEDSGYSNQTEPSELTYFEMDEENKTAIFEWSDTKREMVPLQQEDDECIYRGSFKEDPSSQVLVTGCEWEDRSIQIHSVLYGDTLMNDMVENDEFLQQLHQEQLGKRIKREYVINPDFRKQFPASNNTNRKIIMPKLLDLPINIYLAPSWRSKFGGISGGKSKAKQILSHVKLWYLHSSLDTKINIIFADSNIFDTSADLYPTEDNLDSLENFVSTPPSGYAAIVYLTATTGGSTVGIAIVAAICDSNKKKPRSMSRWYASDMYTAQTVAHEIGHNLGYYHDFETTTDTGRNRTCGPRIWKNGPDNDLMNYAPHSELTQNKWSDCTNEDFRRYFTEVTSNSGSTFCLEELIDGTCYEDDSFRLLDDYHDSATNTPDECIETCASRGYPYAGIQRTTKCFCGNVKPPASRIRDSSQCDAKCPGDASLRCGGDWRLNVYKTVKTVACPIGWTALQTGCYRFVEASTFNLAITRCKEKGGFTAELKSQNEQDVFSQFMKDSGFSKKNVWLGASLVGNEWIWFHSKQKMTFSAWIPGQPSGGGETCVAAWGLDDTTLWNDILCDRHGTMALCQYSPVPAVSGGWSEYSEWSACSETCGIGMKSRSRNCTNPEPQFGGQDCQGDSIQIENCTQIENCPVNGGWSEYSEWSSCSTTCGDGIKSRSRNCSNPQPQFNGQDCQGSNETIISCVEIDCPINGGWSEYSEWSSCSTTCGDGIKSRSRSCSNPQPQFNGQDCQGSNETIISCVEIDCPINGGWSEYSEWSSCSTTCGDGIKARSRNCSNPQPQFDGQDCQGNSNETEKCVEIENCDPVSEPDIVSKTQLDSHQGLVLEAWARKTSKPEAEDCGDGFVCCPDVVDGDNILGTEKFVQESQYKESFLNCKEACQTLYPFSNGITQSKTQRYKNGKPKCWCEFGESLFHKNNGYQTCLYAIEEDDYDY